MSMPERPLTVDQVAEHLGYSGEHVRRLCRDGVIRHFRLGKLIRIPADALKELEESASVSTKNKADTPSESPSTRRIVKLPNGRFSILRTR